MDNSHRRCRPDQRERRHGGSSADTPGSPNLAGIKDAVVDELIELIINTDRRADLITRVRALDRIASSQTAFASP